MAKQIKPEGDITTAQEPATTTATVPNETKSQTELKDQAKPEAYVLSVLQAFPAYEQLYVDKQGGIYTPDTPESLRGMATLYKNPYFTKP
ncbi:MAG: hypothetical protein ACLUH6_05710 [Bacteroides faecis]|uniref:Uncharacterized protein n=1 Tax=Bacteroides faecis TaxID=674529 RepID=A0A6N2V4J6_9BACE